MSTSINAFPLEDLKDVEPSIVTKLKHAGIQSIQDLAVSLPIELVAEREVGRDLETMSELVMKAKKTLIDSGWLDKEFSTAEDLFEKRKKLFRCTTGSKKLDIFLAASDGGGIETQALTEIAGEYGTGKSQLCYTLCVTANTKKENGGFGDDNNVIFIDTENTFRAERIHQIAETRRLDPDEIMKRIFVCKVYSSSHLELVISDLGRYIDQYKAKLVIIDSIISLHRAEFIGRETLADRQQRLNMMLHKLVRLAEIYNIAIVVTNQVQAIPDASFSGGSHTDPVRLSGGNIMAHASTYRIFLRKAGRNRIAIMLDSPCHAYSQVKFSIGEIGIQDPEEDKDKGNTFSEAGWAGIGW
jgi:DNA repair protein RadA